MLKNPMIAPFIEIIVSTFIPTSLIIRQIPKNIAPYIIYLKGILPFLVSFILKTLKSLFLLIKTNSGKQE